MSSAWVIGALLGAVLAGSPFLLSIGDRKRERALDRYARHANLAVTDEVRRPVVRRIITLERAALIGGIGGAGAGLLLSLLLQPVPVDDDAGYSFAPIAILLCAGLGAGVCQALTAAIVTVRVEPGRRIARSTAPDFSDYVPPLEQTLCVAALAGAVLSILGGWLALRLGILHSERLEGGGIFGTLGAVLAGAALLLTAIGAILGPIILRAPQPAGSEQELAWDDALRANTLRSLVTVPAVTALVSIFTTFFEVGARTVPQPAPIGAIGVVALLCIVVAAAVLMGVDLSARPSQHYWRRLWKPTPGPVAR